MAMSNQKNLDPDETETSNEKAMPLTKRLPVWVGVNDKTFWDFADSNLKCNT